jgi:hypothetical protein
MLWPLGIFVGHLVYFSRFGILQQEKSGNPASIKMQLNRFISNYWKTTGIIMVLRFTRGNFLFYHF